MFASQNQGQHQTEENYKAELANLTSMVETMALTIKDQVEVLANLIRVWLVKHDGEGRLDHYKHKTRSRSWMIQCDIQA